MSFVFLATLALSVLTAINAGCTGCISIVFKTTSPITNLIKGSYSGDSNRFTCKEDEHHGFVSVVIEIMYFKNGTDFITATVSTSQYKVYPTCNKATHYYGVKVPKGKYHSRESIIEVFCLAYTKTYTRYDVEEIMRQLRQSYIYAEHLPELVKKNSNWVITDLGGDVLYE